MPATFCALLAAYLIGRFVVPARWTKHARPAVAVVLRAAAAASASGLLLGAFDWPVLLIVFLTVAVMTAIELRAPSGSAARFIVDQCVHVIVLLELAYYFPDAAAHGWWTASLGGLSKWYFAALSCISGAVVCVPAGGVLIARLIVPFTDQIRDHDIAGLTEGGKYIGWLERVLVMLLVLMDQTGGIGFLIAAKSILRFGEIKDASQRKVAEYIIIGTFLSFGWALLVSVVTRMAIRYWLT